MSNIPGYQRTTAEWVVDKQIQELVDKLKEQDPKKYNRAQEYGEFLMNTRFANVDSFIVSGDDLDGNELLYREIVKNITYYGFENIDLTQTEISIMEKKLGVDWKQKLEELIK